MSDIVADIPDGNTYGGTNLILKQLTADDIADLQVQYPHQHPLTPDQYDCWLTDAHFHRHLFDNIDETPWS